jgi:DNA-binding MarR family transcriptional regulator
VPRNASAKEDPVELLADRLHSAAIHLLRRLRKEDVTTGLGPARLSALSVVVFGGPLRISDLAKAEQVKTPTITPIVAALEREGLIVRGADATDARAAILRPTAKGRKLMSAARGRRVRQLAARLQALPVDDRQVLERAASLLRELSR